MNFVLGGRGRVGSAVVSALPSGTVVLDREIYASWARPGGVGEVSDYFAGRPAGSVVYVAAGLIDPRRHIEEHHAVNVTLPRNVIEGATQSGVRVVTFGTVMERLMPPDTANPYFNSKLAFADYADQLASRSSLHLHVRLHTIYGGMPPAPHMFLGLLLKAIEEGQRFAMTSGDQLREYHHVDDDVAAVLTLIETGTSGAIDLSHGSPVKLSDLARYVCERFECLDRLDIGALPRAPFDNYSYSFARAPLLDRCHFRETLPGIYEYLKSCLQNDRVSK